MFIFKPKDTLGIPPFFLYTIKCYTINDTYIATSTTVKEHYKSIFKICKIDINKHNTHFTNLIIHEKFL